MVNVYEIRPGSYATVAEAKEGGSESDVTKEYVDAGLATKQDQLTAGANITIVENVISATGELASTEWGEIGGSMSNQTDLTNALEGKASASDVAGLTTRVGNAESAIAGLDASKMDKVTLATVATTGSYDDLSNKPVIPDVSGLASVTYVDSEIDGVEAQIPDVSGLATKTEVTTGLAGKQNVLTAGDNISIVGDVISATGGSAPSNMMTTDTAQDITARKTITNAGVTLKRTSGATTLSETLIDTPTQSGINGIYSYFPVGTRMRMFGAFSRGNYAKLGSYTDGGMEFLVTDADLRSTTPTDDDFSCNTRTTFTTPYWVNHVIADKANMQKGAGAPTTATVGAEADFYYDTTNDKLYQCTAVDTETPAYTWVEVGGSGSAPSNMVTTDTAQNITGVKTFQGDGGLYANANFIIMRAATISSTPSIKFGNSLDSNYGMIIESHGRAGSGPTKQSTGLIRCNTSSSGSTYERQYVFYSPSNGDVGGLTNQIVEVMHTGMIPEFTITGDDETLEFTVTHNLGKMPGIVQVTDYDGVVMTGAELTITKTATDVTLTFQEAPGSGMQYTVAMLY